MVVSNRHSRVLNEPVRKTKMKPHTHGRTVLEYSHGKGQGAPRNIHRHCGAECGVDDETNSGSDGELFWLAANDHVNVSLE